MIRIRSLALVLVAFASGCMAGEPKTELQDTEIVDGDDAADAYTRRLVLRGTIAFGESLDAAYAARGYAGWLLTGARGSRVILDARALDGTDTVLALYGPQRSSGWSGARPIALNDDYRGSLDSHLDVVLPADGTYLVVVREYWRRPGGFRLELACGSGECRPVCGPDDRCPTGSSCARIWCVRAPCPSYCEPIDPTLACEADSDCVAVPANCCPCNMGGQERAVNRRYADGSAPFCDLEDPPRCLAVYLCGAERPACVANRCEMVPDDGPSAMGCGGRSASGPRECPEGYYCAYPESAMCGWADAPGTCEPRPDACIALHDPVCGCDGQTYSNACMAASAGVSVLHRGECRPAS